MISTFLLLLLLPHQSWTRRTICLGLHPWSYGSVV